MISVGIDHWYRLKEYEPEESIYAELKLLGRQYRHYMRMRVESVLELTHLLDYTIPGIKTLLKGWNETNGKDKLGILWKNIGIMTILQRNRRNSL